MSNKSQIHYSTIIAELADLDPLVEDEPEVEGGLPTLWCFFCFAIGLHETQIKHDFDNCLWIRAQINRQNIKPVTAPQLVVLTVPQLGKKLSKARYRWRREQRKAAEFEKDVKVSDKIDRMTNLDENVPLSDRQRAEKLFKKLPFMKSHVVCEAIESEIRAAVDAALAKVSAAK